MFCVSFDVMKQSAYVIGGSRCTALKEIIIQNPFFSLFIWFLINKLWSESLCINMDVKKEKSLNFKYTNQNVINRG